MSVALGQIAPRDARAIAIDDRVDEQAIVGRRTADMALAAGQEILDLVPLVVVAQGVAVHASASRLPTPHESETK